MRSTPRSAALAAILLAPALALGQAKPTPIDQISMTPIAASTCGAGKSCVYWSSVDNKLHQRTALGADTVIGTGGGGGGSGAATSFTGTVPGSPSSGDVWYDSTAGSFCGSWAGTSDCFARLGANVFTGDQRLEVAASGGVAQQSPRLVLRGRTPSGAASDVALSSRPVGSTVSGLQIDVAGSPWALNVSNSLGASLVSPVSTFTIVGSSNTSSGPNMVFSVVPTYGAGVDAFQWKDGANVLMSLQDDGNRYGVLKGLSSVDVTTLGAAGGNAVMASPADGSSGAMSARALVAADLPGTVVFTGDSRLAPTPSGGNSGQCVQSNGSAWIAGSCGGSGSLPSAGVAGRVPFDNGASYSLTSAGSSTGLLHGGTAPAFGPVVLGAEVSGVLPIGNGGTGAGSTAQNFVFAGPTSGSGAPSYRALVAGDLTGPLGSVYQPLDSDLTAVAGLSATGLVARTASGTAAARSLSCSAELSCSNTDGVSGNPSIGIAAGGVTSAMLAGSIAPSKVTGTALVGTDLGSAVQAFDSDLSAVAGLSSTGMMARTGAGTAAVRTLACSNATCSWTNGDGVSGAPTLALNVGTGANSLCAGNDTRLPPAPSGAGKVIYDTGSSYAAIAAGLNGQCLLSSGAGAPTWGSCSTNQNATTLQGRAVSSAAPSDHDVLGWVAANSDWEPMATATCSAHQAIWGQGSASPTCGSVLTSGQLYIGSTGADPVAASITNGGGITATGGAGSITLGSSCGGDLTGNVGAATVVAARGKAIAASVGTAGAGQDGFCLKYVHSNTDLELVTCGGAGGGYSIVQNAGSNLTAQNTLNCSTGLTCSNDAGNSRTNAVVDQSFSPTWSGVHNFAASALKVDNNSTTNAHTLASSATAARTATFPDATGTVPFLSLAQTWSAIQTHLNAGRIRINNAADTFYSELTSAATANRTITLPDVTSTLAALGLAQTWTAAQTFANAGPAKINNSADTFSSSLASAATANRTWTLPDATDTAVGLAATQTLTNKTISGASNTLSGKFPAFHEVVTGACQAATASLAVSTGSANAPTAVCIGDTTGANEVLGAAEFTATSQFIQGRLLLPDDWVSGTGNDLVFRFRSVGTTGNTVWKLETKCASDSGAVLPTSWNTGQTQSVAAQGTTLFTNTTTLSTITTTGCSAGNLLYWKVTLDSSTTTTGNQDLFSLKFKLMRSVTFQ